MSPSDRGVENLKKKTFILVFEVGNQILQPLITQICGCTIFIFLEHHH